MPAEINRTGLYRLNDSQSPIVLWRPRPPSPMINPHLDAGGT